LVGSGLFLGQALEVGEECGDALVDQVWQRLVQRVAVEVQLLEAHELAKLGGQGV
jgi:hypothetical protein